MIPVRKDLIYEYQPHHDSGIHADTCCNNILVHKKSKKLEDNIPDTLQYIYYMSDIILLLII